MCEKLPSMIFDTKTGETRVFKDLTPEELEEVYKTWDQRILDVMGYEFVDKKVTG